MRSIPARESDPDPPAGGHVVRVFCDADVLIAGAASTRGASHILLRLSELTLIDCMSSHHVVEEARRNIAAKLPAAVMPFQGILDAAVHIVPDASDPLREKLAGQANPKDVAVLAAAILGEVDFLATFNIRHFRPRTTPPLIVQPRRVVAEIRASLAQLVSAAK